MCHGWRRVLVVTRDALAATGDEKRDGGEGGGDAHENDTFNACATGRYNPLHAPDHRDLVLTSSLHRNRWYGPGRRRRPAVDAAGGRPLRRPRKGRSRGRGNRRLSASPCAKARRPRGALETAACLSLQRKLRSDHGRRGEEVLRPGEGRWREGIRRRPWSLRSFL